MTKSVGIDLTGNGEHLECQTDESPSEQCSTKAQKTRLSVNKS